MIRLKPLLTWARTRGLPEADPRDLACNIIEIEPPSAFVAPPVAMMPGDLDRATGAHPWSSLEAERRRVGGAPFGVDGLTRLVFRDVLATPWGFYAGGRLLNREGRVDWRRVLRGPVVHRPRGYYAVPRSGIRYFGHWIKEGLPGAYLAREGEELYLPVPHGWQHARAYVEALEIPRLPHDVVHFDEMSFVDDRWPSRDRLERLARLHAEVLALAPDAGVPGVYMRRGTRPGDERHLANEDDLVAALKSRGFVVLDASDPLDTMWARAGHAPVTVSVEGSHWNNALLFAARGAVHLLISPADRFNAHNASYMEAFDARMAITVAKVRDDGSLAVDVDAMLTLLDRTLA